MTRRQTPDRVRSGPVVSVWQLRRLADHLEALETYARFTVACQTAVLAGELDLPRPLLVMLAEATR